MVFFSVLLSVSNEQLESFLTISPLFGLFKEEKKSYYTTEKTQIIFDKKSNDRDQRDARIQV